MAKKLGQHFLINKSKIKKIIDALELNPPHRARSMWGIKSGDTVIEIGPGHGELTRHLIQSKAKVIMIEKDKLLVQLLKKKFQIPNIKIIEGDALKILPKLTKTQNLKPKSYKLVGNIPYYITGHLLRIISELTASPQRGESRPEISGRKNKPSLIVLTIQKEVAERICAIPPKMNLLAASVQFWAKPKIIGYISKKNFKPTPKVDSAIIKLVPKSQKLKTKSYYSLIRILFKQPRKTILNNLGTSKQELGTRNRENIVEKLQKLNINPNDRPQNLSIKQIRELSTLF